MAYEPAEDSFLLFSFLKKYARGKILDVGCGSGILAKEAMKYSGDVLAADIDKDAVNICRKKGIKSVKSDLFSNVKGKFDFIIFNPPYLPEYERNGKDIALSGGKKGHEIIEKFLKDAKKHLNKNGRILIVVSTLTGNVEKMFKKYGYGYELLKEENYFFERLKAYLLVRH